MPVAGSGKADPAAGDWTIEIVSLPAGIAADDLDDVLLMLRYTFKESAPLPA